MPGAAVSFSAVEIDPLVQILVNLLQNAADALRDHPSPRINIRANEDGERWVLIIEDNGSGVDAEVEPRLFEPFATTKPPGEGTGLGLYTSYMLAQRMGGDLSYSRGTGGGAAFKLSLPRAAEGAEELAKAGDIPQRSS